MQPKSMMAPFRRVWNLIVANKVGALVLTAALAAAGVTITYDNTSDLTTSAADPPVQFAAGTDAGPSSLSDYVTDYSISTNKTHFTATVVGVPEATLTVDSFFRLNNIDDAAKTVTLATSQVSNVKITAYTIALYDDAGVLQDTLDLTAASPSASVTMPASTSGYYGKLTLTLASGTTATDLTTVTPSLTLSVS